MVTCFITFDDLSGHSYPFTFNFYSCSFYAKLYRCHAELLLLANSYYSTLVAKRVLN